MPPAARAAGWQPHEVQWESLQEAALNHFISGEPQRAAACWNDALQLARAHFAGDDPRLGCSLANAASGAAESAAALRAEAQAVWQHSPAWIDRLAPTAAARSSLHHLRLERKNRSAYQAQAMRRLQDAAAQARALLDGQLQKTAAEQQAQWQKEKPPLFTDSRRLLAACYLLVLG